MARQIVFTDSGFWKYSWAHLVMQNVFTWDALHDIHWTAVCVIERWELIAHCMRLKKWSVREREHFYQRDSAYPAFNN